MKVFSKLKKSKNFRTLRKFKNNISHLIFDIFRLYKFVHKVSKWKFKNKSKLNLTDLKKYHYTDMILSIISEMILCTHGIVWNMGRRRWQISVHDDYLNFKFVSLQRTKFNSKW